MIWTADCASVKLCYNGLTTRFFENYTLGKIYQILFDITAKI